MSNQLPKIVKTPNLNVFKIKSRSLKRAVKRNPTLTPSDLAELVSEHLPKSYVLASSILADNWELLKPFADRATEQADSFPEREAIRLYWLDMLQPPPLAA